MALWWVKKETLHFVLSFGKIALSKLLQNVESPFRGAAPLKAHIAPQDPGHRKVNEAQIIVKQGALLLQTYEMWDLA